MLASFEIKSDSYVEKNTCEILYYVNTRRSPVYITQSGEACGVFLDIESYHNMLEALTMMKALQISEKAIQSGLLYPQEEVFAALHAKLDAIK